MVTHAATADTPSASSRLCDGWTVLAFVVAGWLAVMAGLGALAIKRPTPGGPSPVPVAGTA